MAKTAHKIFLVLSSAICVFIMPHAASAEVSKDDAPDWIRRLDYAIEIETDKRPTFYFETVQPLWTSPDEEINIFTQPRISVQGERGKYSAGIGTRRLFKNDTLLLGANAFFDYQALHEHYRGGLGLEVFGPVLEARANYYVGMSSKRFVHEEPTANTYERAVDGVDFEGGLPLPYMNWIKLFGGFYWYDYKFQDDVEGWSVRTEFKPAGFLTVDFVVDDDNKGDVDYRMTTAVKIPFEDMNMGMILRSIMPQDKAYKAIELKGRMLDPVERSFDIEVERWQEMGTIVVAVGRQ